MKPQSLVRKYYIKKEVLGKDFHECQFCGLQYRTVNATRMKQHLLKCRTCPQEVKVLFEPIAAVVTAGNQESQGLSLQHLQASTSATGSPLTNSALDDVSEIVIKSIFFIMNPNLSFTFIQILIFCEKLQNY